MGQPCKCGSGLLFADEGRYYKLETTRQAWIAGESLLTGAGNHSRDGGSKGPDGLGGITSLWCRSYLITGVLNIADLRFTGLCAMAGAIAIPEPEDSEEEIKIESFRLR